MTHAEAWASMDLAIWELGETLREFNEPDLWIRPHPTLLSVGELATHIAYGHIRWLAPTLESPLHRTEANYYPYSIETPLTLNLTSTELYQEIQRINEHCKQNILAEQPPFTDPLPTRPDWTWGDAIQYLTFHVAYHAGQIVSVRHILGHETPDN